MSQETEELRANLRELAGEIVSAYVSNNHVAPADLPSLIAIVHIAIKGLATGEAGTDEAGTGAAGSEKPTPAQIRKSIRPEGLISFIDGKPYKTLKRHLTAHGLDPVSYRERFDLPRDYPMTSQNYSEKRSSLARSIGLGRLSASAEDTPKHRRSAA